MLKDLMYIGLGGALLAKEKVEQELSELVEKGKLNKEEAKKLLDKAKSKGEEEEKVLKAKIKEAVREVLDEMNLATKEDLEEALHHKKKK